MQNQPAPRHFLGSEKGDLCTFVYYLVLQEGKDSVVVRIKDFLDPYKASEEELSCDEVRTTRVKGRPLVAMVASTLKEVGFQRPH